MTATTEFGTRHKIQFPDKIQRYIFYFGVWEPAITAFIRGSLAPGDKFVDIGANIGYYTCLAAKLVGPSGTVYAIEASSSTYELLLENLNLNELDNVRTYNNAVFDKEATLRLFKNKEFNIGRTNILKERPGGTVEEVDALRLHQLIDLETLFDVRLIKIDVEGAEWFADKCRAGDEHSPAALHGAGAGVLQRHPQAGAHRGRRHRLRQRLADRPRGRQPREPGEPAREPPRSGARSRQIPLVFQHNKRDLPECPGRGARQHAQPVRRAVARPRARRRAKASTSRWSGSASRCSPRSRIASPSPRTAALPRTSPRSRAASSTPCAGRPTAPTCTDVVVAHIKAPNSYPSFPEPSLSFRPPRCACCICACTTSVVTRATAPVSVSDRTGARNVVRVVMAFLLRRDWGDPKPRALHFTEMEEGDHRAMGLELPPSDRTGGELVRPDEVSR